MTDQIWYKFWAHQKNQILHKLKLVLSVPRLRMVLEPGAILATFDKVSKAKGFKFQTSSKNIPTPIDMSTRITGFLMITISVNKPRQGPRLTSKRSKWVGEPD